jgi:hypothetical protein
VVSPSLSLFYIFFSIFCFIFRFEFDI